MATAPAIEAQDIVAMSSSGSTRNVTITIPSSLTDAIVIWAVDYWNDVTGTVSATGSTFGGSSSGVVQIGSIVSAPFATREGGAMWYKLAPASGSQTISITFDGSHAPSTLHYCVMSGAAQTDPIDTSIGMLFNGDGAGGYSFTPTTSTANCSAFALVFDWETATNGTWSSPFVQTTPTEDYTESATIEDTGAAGAKTYTYTASNSSDSLTVGMAVVKPAADDEIDVTAAQSGFLGTQAGTAAVEVGVTSAASGFLATQAATVAVDVDITSAASGFLGTQAAAVEHEALDVTAAQAGFLATQTATAAALVEITAAQSGFLGTQAATVEHDALDVTAAQAGFLATQAASTTVEAAVTSAAAGFLAAQAATVETIIRPSLLASGVDTDDTASLATSTYTKASVTPRSGDNRAVLVVAGFEAADTGITFTGATWDGGDLEEIYQDNLTSGSFQIRLAAYWGLETDFPGSAGDVVLQLSSAPSNNALMAVVQIQDADQVTPSVIATDESTSGVDLDIAVSVAADGSLVLGAALSDDGACEADPPMTDVHESLGADLSIAVGELDADAGTSNLPFVTEGSGLFMGIGLAVPPVGSSELDVTAAQSAFLATQAATAAALVDVTSAASGILGTQSAAVGVENDIDASQSGFLATQAATVEIAADERDVEADQSAFLGTQSAAVAVEVSVSSAATAALAAQSAAAEVDADIAAAQSAFLATQTATATTTVGIAANQAGFLAAQTANAEVENDAAAAHAGFLAAQSASVEHDSAGISAEQAAYLAVQTASIDVEIDAQAVGTAYLATQAANLGVEIDISAAQSAFLAAQAATVARGDLAAIALLGRWATTHSLSGREVGTVGLAGQPSD